MNDTLLTTARSERDALVSSGWREVCSRYGTPSVFCVNGSEPKTPQGPFLAFSADGPGRKPVHRCLVGSKHFYSLDPACEGQKTESVVFFASATPSSETPRKARRCYRTTTGDHFVAVGSPCPTGTNDEGTLGFVR